MATGPEPSPDVPRLTAALNRHGVDYLLVGGVAATVHGAARPTLDVDCLVDRSGDNLDRLAGAMRELNARLRVEGLGDAEASLLPVVIDGPALARMEISTWRTDAGAFDVLTDIPDRDGRRRSFGELAERAERSVVDGVSVRVASLADVIASKEWADRQGPPGVAGAARAAPSADRRRSRAGDQPAPRVAGATGPGPRHRS